MAVKKKAKAKPKRKVKAKARKTKARPKSKMKARAKAKPRRKVKAKAKKRTTKKVKAAVGKAWKAMEITNLRSAYKTKPASAIAKTLRRSLASVRGKISALGLKKGPARKAKPKAKKRRTRR